MENQATDRVFRIGQQRNVLVHKFICRGTVEDRIDQLIESKQRLLTDVPEGGAELLRTEMSDRECWIWSGSTLTPRRKTDIQE